ncbi:MAG: hypothetical protein KBA66_17835 [Leptospiraceae bacterium]|mgnify:FL=1|nr:hypothetical protein [Leptospiraceae bacterium]
MKNYLYKFEFISGEYENYFYQQVEAKNEKEAIIEIVSFFRNTTNHKANRFIGNHIGMNWTVDKFWTEMDKKIFSVDEMEGYNLITVKEINFDLDEL